MKRGKSEERLEGEGGRAFHSESDQIIKKNLYTVVHSVIRTINKAYANLEKMYQRYSVLHKLISENNFFRHS